MKIIIPLLAIFVILLIISLNIKTDDSENSHIRWTPERIEKDDPPITYGVLENHMSEVEREDVKIGELSVLGRVNSEYAWGFDYNEVEAIKDSVREISIFDEETIFTYIIHVTLPPNFDENKTYPMLVMTDGVWRFGDHPAIRKMMENGEIQDVILVSIGYDFGVDGGADYTRTFMYYENKKLFLNFITDNLMPYLDELYNIDFENSTLFGHSAGGTFSHYAAFNSDLYENQPFGRYIIASPAFWQIQYFDFDNQNELSKNEFGYFDRHKMLKKEIYVAAGDNEDAYFTDKYGNEESTLVAIESFMKRMEKHGVTTVEYESFWHGGHWEYLADMNRSFMLKYYS